MEEDTMPAKRYIGHEEFIYGVPGRDLDEAEFDALDPDIQHAVNASVIYEDAAPVAAEAAPVAAPAAPAAAPAPTAAPVAAPAAAPVAPVATEAPREVAVADGGQASHTASGGA